MLASMVTHVPRSECLLGFQTWGALRPRRAVGMLLICQKCPASLRPLMSSVIWSPRGRGSRRLRGSGHPWPVFRGFLLLGIMRNVLSSQSGGHPALTQLGMVYAEQ